MDDSREKAKDWLQANPTVCALPFMHFQLETNGDMKPCCSAEFPIEDETGKPINVRDYTIEEMWNHPQRHKFVNDLLSDKKPKQCNRCVVRDQNSRYSKRIHFSTNGKSLETTQRMMRDGIHNFPFELKWIDMMPGNACNLRCRICNAENSSLWAKDYHKLKNPGVAFKGSAEWQYNKSCQWIDDPKFIKSLDTQIFKDLEYLHLLGGEPLMVSKHYEILQKIIDAGYATQITIEYNTNGTYFFNQNQLDILSQFKRLAVNMSIDDIGSRFEYQRKNGVWADVWENIKKFYALENTFVSNIGGKTRIRMTPAISIFNVYYVRDYLNFFRNEGIDVSKLSLNHWVHDWGLDVRELTLEQRQRVLDNIRPTSPEEDIEWLRCIIARLESDDYKPIRMNARDWKFNGFDNIRGESFAQTHPEMHDIIKHQWWRDVYEN